MTTPSGVVTPARPATPAHGNGIRAHGPGHGLARGHAKQHGNGRALGHDGTPVAARGTHGAAGTHPGRAPVASRPAHKLVAKLHARKRAHTAPRRTHHAQPTHPVRHTTPPPPPAKAPAAAPKSGSSSGDGTKTTSTTTTSTTPSTTTTTSSTTGTTTTGSRVAVGK